MANSYFLASLTRSQARIRTFQTAWNLFTCLWREMRIFLRNLNGNHSDSNKYWMKAFPVSLSGKCSCGMYDNRFITWPAGSWIKYRLCKVRETISIWLSVFRSQSRSFVTFSLALFAEKALSTFFFLSPLPLRPLCDCLSVLTLASFAHDSQVHGCSRTANETRFSLREKW